MHGNSMTQVQLICGSCGRAVAPDAKFCTHCGVRVAGTVPCSACKQPISASSKFCVHCGAAMHLTRSQVDSASQLAAGNRWARGPSDFACRFEATDLEGLLKKGITI